MRTRLETLGAGFAAVSQPTHNQVTGHFAEFVHSQVSDADLNGRWERLLAPL